MKKSYIIILIAVLAIFSISTASAGLFDAFGGGNVHFLDLTMNVDGADFEEGDSHAQNDNFDVSFYNISADVDGRMSYISKELKAGKLDENSISDAFNKADESIDNTISYTYDKQTEAQKCAKTILSFNKLSDYKELDINGKKGADFIVSDSVIYDDSGSTSMIPDYITNPDSGKTSDDLARWVLVYDNETDTLYGIEIQSTKTSVVTDESVLQSNEVQSIIDSITFE